MIDELKPYTDYKDSGVAWLGKVPEHWGIPPGFAAFREKCVKNKGMQEDTVLSLSYGRIVVKPKDKLHGLVPESFETYQIVTPGDIIVRSTDLQNDWNSMRVGLVRNRGIITSAYLCFQVISPLDPDYAHALLHTFDLMKVFYGLGSGLRQNLSFLDFKRMLILTPPPEEQAAIVRFLDYANAKIERAIRAKRKLIGLLNEQKQAIIHRAVTRGVDPNVKLKPSGIPWIGDVPKHWEVRRLRTMVHTIDQGISPQAIGFVAEGNSWGVLKSGCVNHGVFRQTEHKQLSSALVIDPSIVVKVGDVIISRACGSPKLVGSVGRVRTLDYRLILSDKTFRAVFKLFVNVDFIVYAMNSPYYRQQVEQAISGAEGMANNLPLSELRSFVFFVPPSDEAKVIASFIDHELDQIIKEIVRGEREIALLREYRTTLTAEVVTGKLDVREAAKRLPDQADELLPADESLDDLIDDEITEEVEA